MENQNQNNKFTENANNNKIFHANIYFIEKRPGVWNLEPNAIMTQPDQPEHDDNIFNFI